MEYRRTKKALLLRLEDGEDIVDCLKAVSSKEKIESALVSGIGACRKAEIAHYNTKDKKYSVRKLKGMLEIVSLSGNIAVLDGKPAAHLHIIISMHDFSTMSGHLMKAEIYPTCEIVVIPLDTKVERGFDAKTGLNLQRLG